MVSVWVGSSSAARKLTKMVVASSPSIEVVVAPVGSGEDEEGALAAVVEVTPADILVISVE